MRHCGYAFKMKEVGFLPCSNKMKLVGSKKAFLFVCVLNALEYPLISSFFMRKSDWVSVLQLYQSVVSIHDNQAALLSQKQNSTKLQLLFFILCPRIFGICWSTFSVVCWCQKWGDSDKFTLKSNLIEKTSSTFLEQMRVHT